MSPTDINKRREIIYSYIEKKQLKSAIENVKQLTDIQQNWSVSEKLTELETNYKFMLHYLVEGKGDPQQDKIYDKLFRDIYILTDEAAESLLMQESSSVFYEKLRVQNVREAVTLDDYIDILIKHADTATFLDLLEEGEEKATRVRKNSLAHENTLRDLFYYVFTSPLANNDFIESLNRFIDDGVIPVNDKCMIISALTLNIFERFDAAKILFLLDVCRSPQQEIAARAIIGIIPIFQIYRERCQLYPDCGNRVKLLSDDTHFNRMFMRTITGYIQAHETEKITKRLNEEIIPEMMKLSPMIGKKIKLDEWLGESGLDDKNPEWQKILDESGLTDKLQEFSDLQMEGADVFHSTFSNLKNYPFFNELSNWFLPFDTQHSSVRGVFSEDRESSSIIASMFETSLICNSDKYSFCFSIMMMPEEYRNMMIGQLGTEGDELKKMQEEELTLNPNQKEESIIKQYIQDLYRFFKLHPRSSNFKDIFNLSLNFHEIEEFNPIVLQPRNLEQVALYYFEKNNFKEASGAYKLLSDKVQPKSEYWQKMGYCKQMMSDIKGALDDYLHAELIEDNNSWLLNRIAHCYRVLKKPETALEYYRRLEQFRPDDLNVQLNIGHCYLELKQYDAALNYYFKVELLDSNNTRAWRSIAWCAFLSNKFDVAQNYYSRILENKPNTHDFLNAGHVELCLANNNRAVEFYKLSQNASGNFDVFTSILEDDIAVLKEAGVDTKILPIIVDKIRYDVE
jgi:tetratricopeptide (TPR) repeat protein